MPQAPDKARQQPAQDDYGFNYGAFPGRFTDMNQMGYALDELRSLYDRRAKFRQPTDMELPALPGPDPMIDRNMPNVEPHPLNRAFKSIIQSPRETGAPAKPQSQMAPVDLPQGMMTWHEGMTPEESQAMLKYGPAMLQGMEQASQPMMLFSPFAAAATTQMAPVAYRGFQEGYGSTPGFHLWNLLRNIPGSVEGSTVSTRTLQGAGYRVPKPPVK